jgi:hypothetical protein
VIYQKRDVAFLRDEENGLKVTCCWWVILIEIWRDDFQSVCWNSVPAGEQVLRLSAVDNENRFRFFGVDNLVENLKYKRQLTLKFL